MPRRARSYSSRPRAQYAWEASRFAPAAIAPGNQVTARLLADAPVNTAEILQRQGLVVTRIVGNLKVVSENVSLDVEWAAGISVINNDAFNANVVADPALDTAQKWMWWEARNSPPANENFHLLYLDIKTKRKLNSRDALYFVIDNLDGFENLEFTLSTRVLVKLP